MSNEQLVTALSRAKEIGKGRFGTIGDISCDIGVRILSMMANASADFFVILSGRFGILDAPFDAL